MDILWNGYGFRILKNMDYGMDMDLVLNPSGSTVHRYFEESTFQYSSGRRRLYVRVLRAGLGRARAENSGPLRPLIPSVIN